MVVGQFGSYIPEVIDRFGKVPGSQGNEATSIWEEGLRDPADQDLRRRHAQRGGTGDHPQQHAHPRDQPQ
ncbi:MAG: hypothetical protein WBP81_00530 [Solirubrobacteraceae bacterium]